MMDMSKITRLVVIDHRTKGNGVVLEQRDISVSHMVQDNDRTLKIFITDQADFKSISFGAKQRKCTTDGCEEQAIDHIIMGGIGSDYCIECADKIIEQHKGERT